MYKRQILIGMACGYVLALVLGKVSFAPVAEAGWFQITTPLHFGIKFELTSIISMTIMCIVGSVEAIGDFTSTAGGGLDWEATENEMLSLIHILAEGATVLHEEKPGNIIAHSSFVAVSYTHLKTAAQDQAMC